MTSDLELQNDVFKCLTLGTNDDVREIVESTSSVFNMHFKRQMTYPGDDDMCKKVAQILGTKTTGMNLLNACIVTGKLELAFYLLEKESSPYFVNAVWGAGNTALHLAIIYSLGALARELVRAGADRDTKNDNGMSPMDIAVDEDMKRVLLGGDVVEDVEEVQSLQDRSETASIAASSIMSSSDDHLNDSFALHSSPAQASSSAYSSPSKEPQDDPYNRKSFYTVPPKVLTPDMVLHVQSKKCRNSIDLIMASCMNAVSVTSETKKHQSILFASLVDVSSFTTSGGGMLYFVASSANGDQRQYSTCFKKAANVNVNMSFKFVLNEKMLESGSVRIVLMQKYEPNKTVSGLLRYATFSPRESQNSESERAKDIEIASITIPSLNHIAANVFHDKTAILYAASSKISVRGNVAVRFYLHRDSFARTPSSFEDCKAVSLERNNENTKQIRFADFLYESDDMQSWKASYGRLFNGSVYFYEDMKDKLDAHKGEVDFAGYKSATIMPIEECAIKNTVKITYGVGKASHVHYFYFDTPAIRNSFMSAVNLMMASIQERGRDVENQDPTTPQSIRLRANPATGGSLRGHQNGLGAGPGLRSMFASH